MIVTNQPRRRQRSKPARPVEITISRVVHHIPRRRQPKQRVPDPAADARVRAVFLSMSLKLPED